MTVIKHFCSCDIKQKMNKWALHLSPSRNISSVSVHLYVWLLNECRTYCVGKYIGVSQLEPIKLNYNLHQKMHFFFLHFANEKREVFLKLSLIKNKFPHLVSFMQREAFAGVESKISWKRNWIALWISNWLVHTHWS